MTDSTAPTPTLLTLPSIVNVSGGNQTVTFTLSAIDDLSGVNTAAISFDRSISYVSNGITYISNGFYFDTWSDSFSDGQSSLTETLSPNTASGPRLWSVIFGRNV